MEIKQTDTALKAALEKRILILDGAFGSLIQSLKLDESDYRGQRFRNHARPLKGNGDILVLSRPEIIEDIHRRYLQAGADIIKTNTFIANHVSQSDYGTEGLIGEMNLQGARLARGQADRFSADNPDKPRFVAGSIGPTNKTCSMSPRVDDPAFREVSFDDMVGHYTEAAEGLLEGGVDLFLIETVFDTLNAKAAIWAVARLAERTGKHLPLMISATISDQSGRTLTGQTIEAFYHSIRHARPFSVGLNCSLGVDQMVPHLKTLARICEFPVSMHPNAGLPDELGRYTQSPQYMGQVMARLADEGLLNIAGGCCGTSPDHIAAIARALDGKAPRRSPVIEARCRLSGLEPLTIDKSRLFVNIGERTNVAGSARFAKLIREKQYDKAVGVARSQVENGAQIIDINLDDPLLDAAAEMTRFLNLIAAEPEVARVPVMIDSSRWQVIVAGLKCLQGKGIVNSISLKEGEETFLERARIIHAYGAAMVVMAFDENGQADSFNRKIEICGRAYRLLTESARIPPQDIIFDANIFAIGTGMREHDRFALDFIQAVAWIKENLPGALTSGGVSNLSFSFRGQDQIREALHSVFLYHAIAAGLDMAIVNPGQLAIYDELPERLRQAAQDLILCQGQDATDRLLSLADEFKNDQAQLADTLQSWRKLPVGERLKHAMVSGQTEYLTQDLDAALAEGHSGLALIEGPLMNGMNQVGELFGAGKMFLPQVVKSARVMKQAVDHLQPGIQAGQDRGMTAKAQNSVLLATVKGDVHDIGKNIVKVVLQCNNYRVVDLGVMVNAQTIIQQAIQEKVDLIGLSGLITPSLDEMVGVAQAMTEAGLHLPLMIGGATTSAQHTALRIAPAATDAAVYVRDASQAVGVANQLCGPKAVEYKTAIRQDQEQAFSRHQPAQDGLLSLEQARKQGLFLDWTNYDFPKPRQLGVFQTSTQNLAEITELIDWRYFFKAWDMPAKSIEEIHDDSQRREADKLLSDARIMLSEIAASGLLRLQGVYGLFAAASQGDDVLVYADEKRTQKLVTLNFLRQQKKTVDDRPRLCLADFIAPVQYQDYIGAFAVCVHDSGALCRQLAPADHYRELMIKILCDRLAEAQAEWLHRQVRRHHWGYAKDERLSVGELFSGKYRGIRPAPGYPPCPDHHEKDKLLISLLQAESRVGIRLSENRMMIPASSVCGYYLAHPQSRYFSVAAIAQDQLADYARRKGLPAHELKHFLANEVR